MNHLLTYELPEPVAASLMWLIRESQPNSDFQQPETGCLLAQSSACLRFSWTICVGDCAYNMNAVPTPFICRVARLKIFNCHWQQVAGKASEKSF